MYVLKYHSNGKYERFYFRKLKHALNYANSIMDDYDYDYDLVQEDDEIKYRVDYKEEECYADIIFIKKIHIMDED